MSSDLEQQVATIMEAATDSEEAAQVGRGILHVQILSGPLSLALKEAIGKFVVMLVRVAYVAGYKAGHAAALQVKQQAPSAPSKKFTWPFEKLN